MAEAKDITKDITKEAPKGATPTVDNDPMADPKLNDFADLEPGDSKVVASGGGTPPIPGVPADKAERDLAADRREAGIPEPPKPALHTDLHATSGGYQVTPAGVTPEELHKRTVEGTRQ